MNGRTLYPAFDEGIKRFNKTYTCQPHMTAIEY